MARIGNCATRRPMTWLVHEASLSTSCFLRMTGQMHPMCGPVIVREVRAKAVVAASQCKMDAIALLFCFWESYFWYLLRRSYVGL